MFRPDLDECPVCETPFALGHHRSRDAVLNKLCDKLGPIGKYTKLEENKATATTTLDTSINNLKTKLSKFFNCVGFKYQYAAVTSYNNTLQPWKIGNSAPDSTDAINTLTKLKLGIENYIKTQNKHTYSDALDTTERLLEFTSGMRKSSHIRSNLESIHKNLDKQEQIINRHNVDHINDDVIAKFQTMAQDINQEIQGPDAIIHTPTIKILKTAYVSVNFMNRGENIAPVSVLSESQNRTLALAIRLAAISMLNTKFKVIVLDDVTMSYDEHRRQNIAKLLDKRFSEFQIILTTHNKEYFEDLKNRFQSSWRFKEFGRNTDNRGSIIDKNEILVEKINKRIANDEYPAGNEMRKACEEWLDSICRQFRTKMPYGLKNPGLHDYVDSG